MVLVKLHSHPWNETLGVEGRWFGLANHRGHGYDYDDVHIKRVFTWMKYIPGLRRIAIRIVAHEIQHCAGTMYERTHHDRPVFEEKGLGVMHECGMSTSVNNDSGKHKGKPNFKVIFTYKHLSPWALEAAKACLKSGSAEITPAKGSAITKTK